MYWEMIDSVPVWLRDYKFLKMLNSPSTPPRGSAVSCYLFSYWSWPRQTKVTALSPLLSQCRGWPDQLLSTLQVWADNYIYCHTPHSTLHTPDTSTPGLLPSLYPGQTAKQQATGRRCLTRAGAVISRQQNHQSEMHLEFISLHTVHRCSTQSGEV